MRGCCTPACRGAPCTTQGAPGVLPAGPVSPPVPAHPVAAGTCGSREPPAGGSALLCCGRPPGRCLGVFPWGQKKKKKESLKSKFYTAFALAPASARGSSAVVWLYGTGLHIPVPYESLGNVRYVGMVQLQFFLPLISCIMWPFEK